MEENAKMTEITPEGDWLPIGAFASDAEIVDDVQVISCDTRDFHILCGAEKPKPYKYADCDLAELMHNKGLSKLHRLFTKTNREKYTISKGEILGWLRDLCEATGGQDRDWRCVDSDVKDCKGWALKYIRFIRNDRDRDEFVVCNAYMFPIQHREVIPNLVKDVL